jgi:hypothetical protein
MAVGSPERHAKLQRFQEIVNGDIGLIPLFVSSLSAILPDVAAGKLAGTARFAHGAGQRQCARG